MKVKRASFDCFARVVNYPLFTSAVPLLQWEGTFACCVSALGQCVPYYQTWYTEISISITMLTHCLGWTLVLHKEIVHTRSRTQAVRKSSLQVAGLQVHATTLSWWNHVKKGNLPSLPYPFLGKWSFPHHSLLMTPNWFIFDVIYRSKWRLIGMMQVLNCLF